MVKMLADGVGGEGVLVLEELLLMEKGYRILVGGVAGVDPGGELRGELVGELGEELGVGLEGEEGGKTVGLEGWAKYSNSCFFNPLDEHRRRRREPSCGRHCIKFVCLTAKTFIQVSNRVDTYFLETYLSLIIFSFNYLGE